MSTTQKTSPLRILRDRAGLTQRELAQRANVDSATISHWERGQRDMSADSVRMMSRVLDCTAGQLLGTEPITEPS